MTCHNSYLSNLAGLCVASPLNLIWKSLGESNAEHPQCVVISGLDIHVSFNQRMPLPNQGPQLVCSEIHALNNSKETEKFVNITPDTFTQ